MKKPIAAITALALASLLCPISLQADNIAYMGVIGGDFGTIDLNTGVFTVLGNSGQTLAGMAVENGMLFGSSYHTAAGTLYSINPANGSLTTIGSSSLDYDDFGSTTSGIFAVGTDTSFYSVNPANGATTLIGPTGIGLGNWRSLSTGASSLYFSSGANLYTLNTSTGAATLVGNMGGPQIGAMLLEGGNLYGGQDSPSLAVDTIDPLTGAATTGPGLTGSTAAFFALAPNPIPLPEPSIVSLLAVGGLARVFSRKRA